MNTARAFGAAFLDAFTGRVPANAHPGPYSWWGGFLDGLAGQVPVREATRPLAGAEGPRRLMWRAVWARIGGGRIVFAFVVLLTATLALLSAVMQSVALRPWINLGLTIISFGVIWVCFRSVARFLFEVSSALRSYPNMKMRPEAYGQMASAPVGPPAQAPSYGQGAVQRQSKAAGDTAPDFSGAILQNANLSGIKLVGANLSRVNLSGARLARMDLTGVNLTGANLTDTDLTDTFLSGANLTGTDLTGANLTRAILGGATLRASMLSGATMTNAVMIGADLTGSDLSFADISSVRLERADLTAANLSSARGIETIFLTVPLYLRFSSSTRWPSSVEAHMRRIATEVQPGFFQVLPSSSRQQAASYPPAPTSGPDFI